MIPPCVVIVLHRGYVIACFQSPVRWCISGISVVTIKNRHPKWMPACLLFSCFMIIYFRIIVTMDSKVTESIS